MCDAQYRGQLPPSCHSHSLFSFLQTCCSSSTTKTATSLACLTHPMLAAGQGAQALPVLMPAPRAAYPHLLPQ